MSNTALGWVNNVATATLYAGSANAALPASNLQVDQGAASMAWQTAAGVVTSAAGATLGIQVSGTWQAFVLARTNLTTSATMRWRVSTGILSIASPNYDSGTISAGVVAGYGQSVLVIGTPRTCGYCQVDIDDPTNPDGFINIPLMYAGPLFIPAVGPDWSSSFGRDDATDEVTTRGGQEYPVYHWQRRRYEAAWQGIKGSEVWPSFMEFDRTARQGGNVLFIPDITSATISQEAVLGRAHMTKDVGYPAKSADARSIALRITERL